MNYKPMIVNKAMIFHLEKPIYGSFYAVWDKWLKIAKKRNLKIVINVNEGTATFQNADEYLQGAKKLERFYKYPQPMIFWGRELLKDIREREKRKKLEKKLEATDGSLMINWLQKLKNKDLALYTKLKEKISKI